MSTTSDDMRELLHWITAERIEADEIGNETRRIALWDVEQEVRIRLAATRGAR